MRSDLAQSYGQDRLPRYTSYPTAPHFSPAIGEASYRRWLKSMPVREPASIYLHVPFCEMRCGFCNLFTKARPDAGLVRGFLDALGRQAALVKLSLGSCGFAQSSA